MEHDFSPFFRKIKNGIQMFFLLFFGIFLFTFFQKEQLPESKNILPELKNNPVQTATTKKDFSFFYREKKYFVHPLQKYELWGLVVSHNNITSWFDAYHDENSVDTKDLCIIWGENLQNNDYQKIKFKNGSWTCYWEYPYGVKFSSSYGSNNHLISNNEEIRKKISNVKIGDQVYFHGFLVNYTNEKGMIRNSSLVRDDTGNHACEVVFVEDIQILSSSTPVFSSLFKISKKILIFLIILRISLFLIEEYFYQKQWERTQKKEFSYQENNIK